jgi:hypothetical protein
MMPEASVLKTLRQVYVPKRSPQTVEYERLLPPLDSLASWSGGPHRSISLSRWDPLKDFIFFSRLLHPAQRMKSAKAAIILTSYPFSFGFSTGNGSSGMQLHKKHIHT